MKLDSNTRILVVAAHPDDEILGCGGTLARAIDSKAEVSVLFLGEGISARFPVGMYDSDEFRRQSRVRSEGAKRALDTLGIRDVQFNNENLCCQFDTLPILSLVKKIEEKISSFQPTLLLTHNPVEVNVDHRITFQAVETACRPTRLETPREIYGFEIVCSGGWTFETSFKPNVFVDITEFWEKKLATWHCYEGESRPFPFPRSSEGLLTLAKYRGMASGLQLAEAFRLLRQVI